MAWAFGNIIESGLLRRAGVAGSIAVHVVFLTWLVFGADVKLFAPSRPDVISVELVPEVPTPKKKDEDKPKDELTIPDFRFDDSKPDNAAAQPPSPPQPASQSKSQTPASASPPAAPAAPAASASPAPAQTPATTQTPQMAPTATASPQQQPPMPATFGAPVTKPDVVEQYGTFFQPLDVGGYDATKDSAKLKDDVVATFRAHLKTCSIRPADLSPSDKVRIVLRVALLRDGTLAAPPALMVAPASAKGPLLMQAAIKALQSCQPYSMLPADKYDEWKLLDLDFTPNDFIAG